MKAIIHNCHTNIFPTDEEVEALCRPGKEADTCIWLLVGSKGFECSSLNKNHSLLERWRKGETVAKRDGCSKVNNFDPSGHDSREVNF